MSVNGLENRNSCRDTSKASAIKREETGARWTLRITGLLTVVTPSSSQTWQWVGPIRVSREWDQSPVARIAIPNPRKKNLSIRYLANEIHERSSIFFREIFRGDHRSFPFTISFNASKIFAELINYYFFNVVYLGFNFALEITIISNLHR